MPIFAARPSGYASRYHPPSPMNGWPGSTRPHLGNSIGRAQVRRLAPPFMISKFHFIRQSRISSLTGQSTRLQCGLTSQSVRESHPRMQELNGKKSKRCCSDEEVLARKEEILQTATELFAEQGFSDAITQVLADRLQLGKGTIYRHFPSKRDLFLAAADRVMRKMQEKILANIAGVEDGLEQVSRGIMAFLSFFAEHPEYVELLIQERAQFKDRKRPTYFEHREVNVVRWRKLYAGLMAEGRVRHLPVEQITNVVGNLIYGTMFTNYFIGQAKPVEEQAQEILDIVFRGILTQSELARLESAAAGDASFHVVAKTSTIARAR